MEFTLECYLDEAAGAVSESVGGVKPPLFTEIKVFREFVCVDA